MPSLEDIRDKKLEEDPEDMRKKRLRTLTAKGLYSAVGTRRKGGGNDELVGEETGAHRGLVGTEAGAYGGLMGGEVEVSGDSVGGMSEGYC